jgi:sulfur-oxidizing protein SoxX
MPFKFAVPCYLLCLLLISPALILSACSEKPPPVKGFVLPEGDVKQGEQVFVKYNCHHCHAIAGVELPQIEFEPPFILELGGKVYRVRNYGELLTSVVNPDHIITGKYIAMLEEADREALISPMPYFNEDMTVAELIDLVAFLHAQYSLLLPAYYKGHYVIRP